MKITIDVPTIFNPSSPPFASGAQIQIKIPPKNPKTLIKPNMLAQ
jgi:hypothetical protein